MDQFETRGGAAAPGRTHRSVAHEYNPASPAGQSALNFPVARRPPKRTE